MGTVVFLFVVILPTIFGHPQAPQDTSSSFITPTAAESNSTNFGSAVFVAATGFGYIGMPGNGPPEQSFVLAYNLLEKLHNYDAPYSFKLTGQPGWSSKCGGAIAFNKTFGVISCVGDDPDGGTLLHCNPQLNCTPFAQGVAANQAFGFWLDLDGDFLFASSRMSVNNTIVVFSVKTWEKVTTITPPSEGDPTQFGQWVDASGSVVLVRMDGGVAIFKFNDQTQQYDYHNKLPLVNTGGKNFAIEGSRIFVGDSKTIKVYTLDLTSLNYTLDFSKTANASVVALSGDQAIVGDEKSMTASLFIRSFSGNWDMYLSDVVQSPTYGNQVHINGNFDLVGGYGNNYTGLIFQNQRCGGNVSNYFTCTVASEWVASTSTIQDLTATGAGYLNAQTMTIDSGTVVLKDSSFQITENLVLQSNTVVQLANSAIYVKGITMSPESTIELALDTQTPLLASLFLGNCTNLKQLTFRLSGNFGSGTYTILRQPKNCSFSMPKFTGVPLCASISDTSVNEYGVFRITLGQTCVVIGLSVGGGCLLLIIIISVVVILRKRRSRYADVA